MRGYSKTTPADYADFLLCREMGWTFSELESQESWRVEQAFLFLEREALYKKTLED